MHSNLPEPGTITLNRRLSASGEILVQPGQAVSADAIIGQTAAFDDISVVNVGQMLQVSSQDISPYLLANEGDAIEIDQPIAEISGRLPFSKKTCLSPVSGQITAISGNWLASKARIRFMATIR